MGSTQGTQQRSQLLEVMSKFQTQRKSVKISSLLKFSGLQNLFVYGRKWCGFLVSGDSTSWTRKKDLSRLLFTMYSVSSVVLESVNTGCMSQISLET